MIKKQLKRLGIASFVLVVSCIVFLVINSVQAPRQKSPNIQKHLNVAKEQTTFDVPSNSGDDDSSLDEQPTKLEEPSLDAQKNSLTLSSVVSSILKGCYLLMKKLVMIVVEFIKLITHLVLEILGIVFLGLLCILVEYGEEQERKQKEKEKRKQKREELFRDLVDFFTKQ